LLPPNASSTLNLFCKKFYHSEGPVLTLFLVKKQRSTGRNKKSPGITGT